MNTPLGAEIDRLRDSLAIEREAHAFAVDQIRGIMQGRIDAAEQRLKQIEAELSKTQHARDMAIERIDPMERRICELNAQIDASAKRIHDCADTIRALAAAQKEDA